MCERRCSDDFQRDVAGLLEMREKRRELIVVQIEVYDTQYSAVAKDLIDDVRRIDIRQERGALTKCELNVSGGARTRRQEFFIDD